jgi:hypothetical protein
MRTLLWLVGAIIVGVLALLAYALACSKVDPVVFESGPDPGLTGVFEVNELGEHEEFADTGGYPLGMRVDRNNNVIVADAELGLLSISQDGVAVALGDEFVLVSETSSARVRRLWLKGDRVDTDDMFIENLPGAPDNLSVDGKGMFWLAIVGLHDPDFEKLGDKPFVRRLLGALPVSSVTPDRSHAFVLGLDGHGNVVHNLQQPQSRFDAVTSAMRHGNRLYVGSLATDAVGVLQLD